MYKYVIQLDVYRACKSIMKTTPGGYEHAITIWECALIMFDLPCVVS